MLKLKVLEQPFTEAEIHLALMGMNGDKAPGPDGFTVAFSQFLLGVREKRKIVDVFNEFYEDKSFAKSLNSTFLVLIPKKGGAEDLGDFRPISLLGGMYKLLVKVLSNRIKEVLDKVVSPDQNAFVKGRQILDASLIANEHLVLEKILLKSEVIPVGEVEDIEMLAVELGCKVGTLPSVYLGLPLGAKHKAMAMWDGVEARMRRRLALWKRQYLSKDGRITLIKSTLASMPIYQLSLFRMPKLVVKRLEKLQRDFLWGGGSMERKIHLINWAVVCTQKESGGLGIRKIDLLNKALLGKWIWRFAIEEDFFWRKSGKGTKVRLWTDHWCGNEVLAQTFPQLFELAVQRNASINEMWDSSLGQGGWNIRLSRNLNDWELDALGELLHLLRDLRTSLEEDTVIWKGESHGLFRIRDAYKLLAGSNVINFPKKGIWVDKVPTKVAFFAWEASWEKVLTLDKLQRRGWQFPNRCFLCGCEEENVNHILLHCTVVRALWEIVLALFGANWVFPEKVKDMLVSWRGPFVGRKRKRIWTSIPLCIFWTVWKERNRLAFRRGSLAIQKLKNSFVCNLWSWARVYMGEESSSLIGFLEWLAAP
ncbi:putative ribonuclease H protein [Vitis vinifera]|uniref:Putative ribonuclease H protein n=1 Tax=Vitis vinifera TaxID=29760 RepID=A0A438DR74_VITVI|nr:putative ribonuclease H protein [Vitis vinifera]